MALDTADAPPTTRELAASVGCEVALAWRLLHTAERHGHLVSWPDDGDERRWARWVPPRFVHPDPVRERPSVLT